LKNIAQQITSRGRRYALGLLGIALLAATLSPVRAAIEANSGIFNGIEIRYRVLLPDNYDAERSYPVVLHFAGGPQTWRIVESSTNSDWRAHVEQRDIIVVSPEAPRQGLYFEGGDRIFPEFIEHILASYRAQGGKLHITGHSNGGLSAFHIASLYPEHVISVTGYPGLLRQLGREQIEALRPLCLYMHVGDNDPSWRNAMKAQSEALVEQGLKIEFHIESDQPHRLDTSKANLAMRLFDELAATRAGC
jgi:poly(3-hydroxybutyrate) depolymerase